MKSSQLGVLLLSAVFALSLASTTPVFAADRILQLLGACGEGGVAEYVGNRKHGRVELVSPVKRTEAGIVLEGLEGKTLEQLKTINMDFEPPVDSASYTFVLRVKASGPNGGKSQRFTIGPDSDPDLPNLPASKNQEQGNTFTVRFGAADLVGGKSNLELTDKITKVAFVFSSTRDPGPIQRQFIDDVFYGGQQVFILLEPATCNLR